MTITFRAAVLRLLMKTKAWSVLIAQIPHMERRRIESGEADDGDYYYFKLTSFNAEQLKIILEVITKMEGINKITIKTLTNYIDNLANPANAKVRDLKGLEKIFKEFYLKLENRWLLQLQNDGTTCPVLVKNFKYVPPSKYNSAYFNIELGFGMYSKLVSDDDDRDQDKGHFIDSDSVSFYYHDLRSQEEIESGTDADDFFEFNDDEDEDEKKPVEKKTKGVGLLELLTKKGLYMPGKDLMENYVATQKKFYEVCKSIGHVYTSEKHIYRLNKSRYWGSWDSNKFIPIEDGTRNKLVVDTYKIPYGVQRSMQAYNYENQPVPYHPYILMYDITKHSSCMAHVDHLDAYEFNDKIVDELVLPNNNKKLLGALMQDGIVGGDIVQGKSGGVIVLSSGKPGTGKTLTAEVYAETLHKPLYQIQSSQLGISVDDIENNLQAVLRRAQKWNAVLLIDECDTYVYKRGDNILQNCIVGTFLRLLEYFNGVLFMTTNKSDIVDEAIMSRVTAHFKYGIPDLESKIAIAVIIGRHYGIKVDQKEAKDMFTKMDHMSGRDIRNMMKLLKKYYHGSKEIRLNIDNVEPLKDFIPYLQ